MGRPQGFLPYAGMLTIWLNDYPWLKYILIGRLFFSSHCLFLSKEDVEIIILQQEKNSWSWERGLVPVIPEEILFDPEGNLWIASKDGLFIRSNTLPPTTFVKHNKQKSKSLFTKTPNHHLIYINGAVFETSQSGINKI